MEERNKKKELTPEQHYVTQEEGTEPAFSGKYTYTETKGSYACVVCGETLFGSETKFDSGTGWPSFWEPANKSSVETQLDDSLGMERTEVHCMKCKAHLGHVFPDGPNPTGLRYCINSVSLDLEAEEEE